MFVIKRHYPRILYPFINPKHLVYSADYKITITELLSKNALINSKSNLLTCVIQHQTNWSLALESFYNFSQRIKANQGKNTYLVMASFKPIKKEVQRLASELKLDNKVIYLQLRSNDDLILLINSSKLLMYTNQKEFFGILPVKAMHLGCLVLACNDGSSLE